MARLVPLLSHLVPPSGVSGLRLDRFSPGFDDAERLGFLDVAPLPSYAAVYPFGPEAANWARVVGVTGPVDFDAVVVPFGDEWVVVGVVATTP